MPYLRVVNWNPGGEGGGRDAALDHTVGQINAATAMLGAPQNVAVQAIAIQEANQGANGAITQMFANQIGVVGATFEHFTCYNISEHHAVQNGKVGHSRGYIVALRTGGASPVVPVAPAPAMIGANSGAGPLYRIDLLNDAGANGAVNGYHHPRTHAALTNALRNTRWPVFTCFTVGGVRVVFVTVHLDLRANWLGAVVLPNPWMQGLKECIGIMFQNSTWYASAMGWIGGGGGGGAMVISGDLNATAGEIGQPGILPAFDGTNDNLTHILADSPAMGGANVHDDWAQIQNFPPHHILTSGVQW